MPILLKKFLLEKKSDKFGISLEKCFDILKRNKKNKNISIDALSVHIGSQIKEVAPFQKTLNLIDKFIDRLNDQGIKINHLDLGGGMGILLCFRKKFRSQKICQNCSSI